MRVWIQIVPYSTLSIYPEAAHSSFLVLCKKTDMKKTGLQKEYGIIND